MPNILNRKFTTNLVAILRGWNNQTKTLIAGPTASADLSALFIANVFGKTSAKMTTNMSYLPSHKLHLHHRTN